MIIVKNLNLRVDKKILIVIAGLMWCGVGIMLTFLAVTWIEKYGGKEGYLFYAAGFLTAMPVHIFGFSKIADRNINRLLPIMHKKNVFSFITLKSYLTIIVMVALGITLRHSAIPKQYLSIVYNGIGLALFLSGLRYFKRALKLFREKRKQSDNSILIN